MTSQESSPSSWDNASVDAIGSFGGSPDAVISELAVPMAEPMLVRDNEETTVIASCGVYAIADLRPESLSLRCIGGSVLVRESYFTLRTPSFDTMPVNGRIVESSSVLLVLEYDLVSMNDEPSIVASMQVTIDFSRFTAPKITAEVTEVRQDILDWRVIWVVVPADQTSIVLPGVETASFPLDQFIGLEVPVSNLSVKLVDPSMSYFVADWSDAMAGTMSVKLRQSLGEGSVLAMEVALGVGVAEIDPSLVVVSSTFDSTDVSCQRKTFWYGGHYWAFYYSGTSICYNCSADGVTWKKGYILPESTPVFTGMGFDVASSNGRVAVAWLAETGAYDTVYFKLGTILGDKVQWAARRPVYANVANPYSPVSLAIDLARARPGPRWPMMGNENGKGAAGFMCGYE